MRSSQVLSLYVTCEAGPSAPYERFRAVQSPGLIPHSRNRGARGPSWPIPRIINESPDRIPGKVPLIFKTALVAMVRATKRQESTRLNARKLTAADERQRRRAMAKLKGIA